ncbi:serine protease [Sinorhizobium meliloti]|uniref:S1 family peptidase n=1 Tax=Rhizobium meliloti TaxID=382 RepID=UPI000FD9416B|nr:serine protease [Sinorhizobium meliloti]RVI63900.1 serine protease [Sinorhizobium meliloti]
MKGYVSLLLLIAATSWLGLTFPSAAAVERTIVYIECALGERTSRGTGVVVSPQGHILTAKHVIFDPNARCQASIGVADPNSARLVIRQPANPPNEVDVALIRFADQQQYEYMRFCSLEDWMIRRKIFVAGFPAGTETGSPSFREGVLSTVFPNQKGLIETDGQTIAGMSGGPVFSNNLAGLVGLVIGAKFDPGTGLVNNYAILPVSDYAAIFNLTVSDVPCYHRGNEVELPAGLAHWTSDSGPKKLGVRVEQGICFLTSIGGMFNGPNARVSIEVENGEYVLSGVNPTGQVGASVRCIWYD